MDSSEDGLRLRRETAEEKQSPSRRSRHSQQQRSMFRQMKTHRHMQHVQTLAVQESLSDLTCSYLKVLVGVCAVGLVLLCILVSPSYVLKRTRNLFSSDSSRPLLPSRNLVLIPPAHVSVKRMLPRVYRNYAVATPENAAARRVVRETAALRKFATHSGPYYRQHIALHTVEHEEVQAQLPTDQDKDAVCGSGFARAYSTKNAAARDHLVLFCLLALGTHDGYILWNTTLTASLTRGTQGVVAKYVNQNRVHSSLLLLPILSRERVAKKQQQANDAVQPSTLLPLPTLEWLIRRVTGDNSQTDYVRDLEEFLYARISQEPNWVWLNAACSSADRARLEAQQQRRIGTTCSEDDMEECCSFYDPSMKVSAPRPQHQDEDN